MIKEKRDLIQILNNLYLSEENTGENKSKSGRNKLKSCATSIIQGCKVQPGGATLLGKRPCLISTLSLDGRGRSQRKMRIGTNPINFRPWHITWISQNGPAPLALQYSHRCNTTNCVEPSHGCWETDQENKSRHNCKSGSHLLFPDGKIFQLCTHTPCCYTPERILSNDNRFIAVEDIN